jgi:hypothetical protein
MAPALSSNKRLKLFTATTQALSSNEGSSLNQQRLKLFTAMTRDLSSNKRLRLFTAMTQALTNKGSNLEQQ